MRNSIRGQAGPPREERLFDLSGLILAKKRITRTLQATFAATAATSGAGLAYVIASALANGTSTTGSLEFTSVVTVMVAVFFVASILATIGVGTGATRCALDGNGLRLRYRSGREKDVRSNDPRFRVRLTLVRNSSEDSYDLTAGLPMLNPLLGFPMLDPISAELYSAVLGEVQDRGLDVRSDTTRAHGISVTTHQIRAASPDPA